MDMVKVTELTKRGINSLKLFKNTIVLEKLSLLIMPLSSNCINMNGIIFILIV